MITGDTPNTTFSVNPAVGPAQAHPLGDYTLEIRRRPQYGTILYPPMPGHQVPRTDSRPVVRHHDPPDRPSPWRRRRGTDVKTGYLTVTGATTTLTFDVLKDSRRQLADIEIPINRVGDGHGHGGVDQTARSIP